MCAFYLLRSPNISTIIIMDLRFFHLGDVVNSNGFIVNRSVGVITFPANCSVVVTRVSQGGFRGQ